jgi:membrane protein YqaA with SNARE-associated domain
VRNLRESLVVCGWALLGAVLGGGAMYLWGWLDPASAAAVLDFIPAINPAMVDGVESSLEQDGLWALFTGPAKGVPYKIYAVKAGELGFSAAGFLLVSLPARLLRFVLVMFLVSGISQSLFRGRPLNRAAAESQVHRPDCLLGAVLWMVFLVHAQLTNRGTKCSGKLLREFSVVVGGSN